MIMAAAAAAIMEVAVVSQATALHITLLAEEEELLILGA
jgi:hypothetical protein